MLKTRTKRNSAIQGGSFKKCANFVPKTFDLGKFIFVDYDNSHNI